MAKRLQVMLQDPEYREVQRAARRRQPVDDTRRKLDAVCAAVAHSYPTGDIENMLAEIESGYGVAERLTVRH